MTIQELLNALNERQAYEYQGDPSVLFSGFGLKTSRDGTEGLFFIISDTSWDKRWRNLYVKSKSAETRFREALSNGARGFVADKSLRNEQWLSDSNVIFVENTFDFYFEASRAVRHFATAGKVIAITGSAGKSTTTMMLDAAISDLAPSSTKLTSQANKNATPPVLRQISQIHEYDYNVVEVSGSTCQYLTSRNFSIAPDIAIITSISEAHLNRHGSLEGVARDKSDIFSAMPKHGLAVINADTPFAELLLRRATKEGVRIITYGESPDSDMTLVHYDPSTQRVTVRFEEKYSTFALDIPGKHMAMNSLAVMAAIHELGIATWDSSANSIKNFKALAGRGELFKVNISSDVNITIIDDSYNANPASIRASLSVLQSWPISTPARKILLLGEIKQLGSSADAVHRGFSHEILSSNADDIILVGSHMKALYQALKDQHPSLSHWEDVEGLSEYLFEHFINGDVVLAKGSNATRIHEVVAHIRERATV